MTTTTTITPAKSKANRFYSVCPRGKPGHIFSCITLPPIFTETPNSGRDTVISASLERK